MAPPERTLGPIGWKGLFGGDDAESDDGSDDESSTSEVGSADADRRGTDTGSEAPARSGAAAIRDERHRRAGELSEGDAGSDEDESPLDEWVTLDELSREDRGERTAERSAAVDERGTAASTTPTSGEDRGPSSTGDEATAGSGTTVDGATSSDPEATSSDPGATTSETDAAPESSTAGAATTGAGTGDTASSGRDVSETTGRTVSRDRDRPPRETAEPPGSEPRVRTPDPGVEPEEDTSSPERTLGPIGVKWPVGEDEETEAVAAGAAETGTGETRSRTDVAGRSAGTVALDRRPVAVEEEATAEEALLGRVPWSVSITAIGVGVGLLVFLDIVSMMVPLIAAIGAGIVGGFVAGYISGGTVRGAMHALAVGVIGGTAVGYLTALVGALIGLFLEPATLLGRVVGPITPELGIFGAWGPLLVMILVATMIAVDATIAGAVGGTLRSMVDEVR